MRRTNKRKVVEFIDENIWVPQKKDVANSIRLP